MDVTGDLTGGTLTLSNSTLDVGGKASGGTVTANNSAIDIGGTFSGGSFTLNSSNMLVEGSVSGGQVTYGTGVDSLELKSPNAGNNNEQLVNFNDNDSIAITTPFTSATYSGGEVTLKNGATTVATFTHVTLASGAATTFFPVSTEVINGTTYYVAKLDPPAGAGTKGVGGSSKSNGHGGGELVTPTTPTVPPGLAAAVEAELSQLSQALANLRIGLSELGSSLFTTGDLGSFVGGSGGGTAGFGPGGLTSLLLGAQTTVGAGSDLFNFQGAGSGGGVFKLQNFTGAGGFAGGASMFHSLSDANVSVGGGSSELDRQAFNPLFGPHHGMQQS